MLNLLAVYAECFNHYHSAGSDMRVGGWLGRCVGTVYTTTIMSTRAHDKPKRARAW